MREIDGHIKSTAQGMRRDDMIVTGLGKRTATESLYGQ
jgi:hypothetical protein